MKYFGMNVNVDYSTEANNRGYRNGWIDAMDSIYKTGKKNHENSLII